MAYEIHLVCFRILFQEAGMRANFRRREATVPTLVTSISLAYNHSCKPKAQLLLHPSFKTSLATLHPSPHPPPRIYQTAPHRD